MYNHMGVQGIVLLAWLSFDGNHGFVAFGFLVRVCCLDFDYSATLFPLPWVFLVGLVGL